MVHPKINQRWVVKNKNGKVLKRLRILGPSPLGALQYLYITDGGTLSNVVQHFGSIPVENLEKIFELEQDVCDHRNIDDYYDRDSPVPTHHLCLTCGDKFPNTADTDFWFPKVLEPVKA